jgi:hypothetical protein
MAVPDYTQLISFVFFCRYQNAQDESERMIDIHSLMLAKESHNMQTRLQMVPIQS